MQSNPLQSKLPNVGTTIFTTMSAMAAEYDAINLSQGFPSFDCPAHLAHQAQVHINEAKNQYAPMTGVPALNLQIVDLVKRCYGRDIALEEVTVTSGATEALFVAIQTIVEPGDEVIVFDPVYDSYEPGVDLAGGRCVHIPLFAPDYRIDWQRVKEAVTPKTKAIMLNTPHNPSGTVITAEDIEELTNLVNEHDLYVISDEVYEHIVFDDATHHSILRYDELYKRSFVVSSFGKTFHVTGWKIGYCIAPVQFSEEFRKIHQYVTFSTCTPMQWAIADMLAEQPEHVDELRSFYQQKRDFFANAMQGSRFQFLPCKGTYFQLMDYSAISGMGDMDFAEWLTKEKGIATVPLSPFYGEDYNDKIIRVCFAKDEETLANAAKILKDM